MENLEAVRELFKHPGWQAYLDLVETDFILPAFQEMFFMEPNDPDNLVKFISLKSRIDSLRDVTYFFERQLAEQIEEVDNSYTKRFVSLMKRLFRRS